MSVRLASRDKLSAVTLRTTWLGFKTELIIQTTTMEPVADVPGMSRGQIVLAVARKDRPAAERLVADLHLSADKPVWADRDLA